MREDKDQRLDVECPFCSHVHAVIIPYGGKDRRYYDFTCDECRNKVYIRFELAISKTGAGHISYE